MNEQFNMPPQQEPEVFEDVLDRKWKHGIPVWTWLPTKVYFNPRFLFKELREENAPVPLQTIKEDMIKRGLEMEK